MDGTTFPDPVPEALIVDVDGFEGPLDLLLSLARNQKVDLAKISILALAEQYIAFIAEARRLRLEIAADYLVMAAWLAYLKSRLLLPVDPEEDGPPAEELAARLAFRLRKLEAMREAGARLFARDRLGHDVFARGMPEGLKVVKRPTYRATLYDLLHAYAEQRSRAVRAPFEIRRPAVFSLEDAIGWLERLLGHAPGWERLEAFLPPWTEPELGRSALASTFVASLELARQGRIALRQTEPFGPISLRALRPDPVEVG